MNGWWAWTATVAGVWLGVNAALVGVCWVLGGWPAPQPDLDAARLAQWDPWAEFDTVAAWKGTCW